MSNLSNVNCQRSGLRVRVFTVFVLSSLSCFSGHAQEPAGGLDKKIIEKIRVKHQALSCRDWQSFGAETPRVLERMLEAPERESDRLKLIEGLGCFSDSQSKEALRALAEKATSSLQRNVALESATRWGADSETMGWVRTYLEHEDPTTRYSAAQSLIQGGGSESQPWVQTYLAQEKVGWIRKKLEARLSRGTIQPVKDSQIETSLGGSAQPRVKGLDAPEILNSPNPAPSDIAGVNALKKKWAGDWRGIWVRTKPAMSHDIEVESVTVQLRITWGESLKEQPVALIAVNGEARVPPSSFEQAAKRMGPVQFSQGHIYLSRPPQSGSNTGASGPALGAWMGTLEVDTSQGQVLVLKPAPGIRFQKTYQPSRMVLFRVLP